MFTAWAPVWPILVELLEMELPAMRIAIATFLYWAVTGALIVFGVWGFFSIGLPFLAVGFTLAALSGARRLPHIFWPPVVGVILFFATYILVAPLGCSTTATPVEVVGPGELEPTTEFSEQRTTCDRLLLPDTTGSGSPSLWPSALAAVAAAVGGANLTRMAIRRRARRRVAPMVIRDNRDDQEP